MLKTSFFSSLVIFFLMPSAFAACPNLKGQYQCKFHAGAFTIDQQISENGTAMYSIPIDVNGGVTTFIADNKAHQQSYSIVSSRCSNNNLEVEIQTYSIYQRYLLTLNGKSLKIMSKDFGQMQYDDFIDSCTKI